MDQLANQISSVSLYDVKAYVRKAQNAVLNFSDMEAKVREATNNEPWGTPTSVMQQIADGTNNYQQFHEIMPFVYRRFTEKSAAEWRQIYKALQLLDYLVRNGSERVVDYARSHISVIEMLRHFSYVDRHGTDQGASIRKRADELVSLLGSTDKLRTERKKSRQLNQKTAATVSRSGGFGGSGSKYGGFSSDSYRQMKFGGSASQQVFGDGGGFDGSNHIVAGAAREDDFEEYDAGDAAEGLSGSAAESHSNRKAGELLEDEDDDDFADFQVAPTAATSAASSTKPITSSNILDLFDSPAPAPASSSAAFASSFQPAQAQPSYAQPAPPAGASASLFTSPAPAAPAAAPKKAPVDDIFGSIWESSKSAPMKPAPKSAPAAGSSGPASPAVVQTSAPPASNTTNTSSGEVDLLSF